MRGKVAQTDGTGRIQNEDRVLRGIALVVAATFLFAMADTLGKHLVLTQAARSFWRPAMWRTWGPWLW